MTQRSSLANSPDRIKMEIESMALGKKAEVCKEGAELKVDRLIMLSRLAEKH